MSFRQSARLHQAEFRDASTSISAGARSPCDDKGRRRAHFLALGREEENLFPGIRGRGGAVEYFRDRGFKWNRDSFVIGDSRDGNRPTRNMASSQVACVNFLLPLVEAPGALAAALRAIDEDVRDVVAVRQEDCASPVVFEWVGRVKTPEGALGKGAYLTTVNALVLAETEDGGRRAYLFDWKYDEDHLHPQPRNYGEGSIGDTRRREYLDGYSAPFSSFDLEAAPDLDEFLYMPFYRIMQQRHLADQMVRHRQFDVEEAKLVVVVPEANAAFRSLSDGDRTTSPPLAARFPRLETVEAVMHAVLKDPGSQFAMVAPSTLLDAVVEACAGETDEWASYWRERYGA